MKQIKLTQGKYALIDDEDYELISRYRWVYSSKGYAITHNPIDGRQWIWMHRIIMGTPNGSQTDHINRNKLDNRKINLRVCSASQNRINASSSKTFSSKYRGVSWNTLKKKWTSQIQLHGKRIFIGRFQSEIHAAMAYDIWAKELHKEFAICNFV